MTHTYTPGQTPEQVKQEILEEFSRFYGHSELVSVEDVEHDHGIEYVSDALDRMAEAVRDEVII